MSFGTEKDNWALFPEPIGLPNIQRKTDWAEFNDTKRLVTFSEFFDNEMWTTEGDPDKRCHTYLGFFCTIGRGGNWEANQLNIGQYTPVDWSRLPWHAWLGIIVKHPGRRQIILVIFGTNAEAAYPRQQTIHVEELPAQQAAFIARTGKRLKLKSVWIGGIGNTDEGLCMRLTGEGLLALIKNWTIKQRSPWTDEELRSHDIWRKVQLQRRDEVIQREKFNAPDSEEGSSDEDNGSVAVFQTMMTNLREGEPILRNECRHIATSGGVDSIPSDNEDKDHDSGDLKCKLRLALRLRAVSSQNIPKYKNA